jgi:hypothetical protein
MTPEEKATILAARDTCEISIKVGSTTYKVSLNDLCVLLHEVDEPWLDDPGYTPDE